MANRIIGVLGDIPFYISEKAIQSFSSATWSGSANVAEHKRLNGNALTQHTGLSADKMKFTIYISAALGVNPLDAVTQIIQYERSGTPIVCTIGEKSYGKYRWLVSDHTADFKRFYRNGNVFEIELGVSLIEYLRR